MPDHDAGSLDPATQAVWGGEDRYLLDRATQVPVVHSVAFGYEDIDEWQAVALGEADGHIYGRNTNPTVAVFEEKLRILESAEAATSAATGMAAISNSLYALLAPGKRVVSVKDTYGGTSEIFTDFLPAYDVEVELVDTTDFDAIEAEVAEGCDVLYLETPTNPTLKILDLERLTAAGHAAGAIVMVDNTFATPINQSPLALGADLVLHSATKFLGGHADALGGVVAGRAGLIERIYHYREINGATLDPMAAYLLLRGMKTLHLRIERQIGQRRRRRRLPRSARPGRAGQLSRAREPPPARAGGPPDARFRRHAQLRRRRWARCGQAVPSRAPAGPPGRQPRFGRNHRRPSGDHEPRRSE